jgi:hypothetical protein
LPIDLDHRTEEKTPQDGNGPDGRAEPMPRWYAIFKDKPQDASCTEERMPRAMVLQRFDHAMALGMHDGRTVIGMWLIDEATQQGDVIRIHGLVPGPIRARHEVYLRENKSPTG